ncbi:EKC/KEOPS complex subunit LAGE3 [Carlito syrichta]|uniref:L antigen family member 3 n=1 Tax=Carlito syrichta TaxID=1868482 RepID=A0A3Q0EHM0_CARSF|nr:EKC/KEOPS complex subunit LAGE3 [Carlito syrichta]
MSCYTSGGHWAWGGDPAGIGHAPEGLHGRFPGPQKQKRSGCSQKRSFVRERSQGTAADPAGEALHVAGAPHAPGPGTDTAPAAGRPGIRPHTFTLSVPFPTPLEAEVALGSLAPDAEPHQRVVGKDLTVSGSVLAVHWKAEDCRLLRISIINFLDQLSLVVRTMQRFGPPFPTEPGLEKGADV